MVEVEKEVEVWWRWSRRWRWRFGVPAGASRPVRLAEVDHVPGQGEVLGGHKVI